MTIREIARRLKDAGIEDGDREALLLAEHCTGRSRTLLLGEQDRELDCPELAEMVEKRCTRYPLQYLFGAWEFMGLSFLVNENCLIPRADTEILVEEALSCLPEGGTVLDLCTGSGCIAAAILHYAPTVTGMAVELFPETLACAEENFRRLGVEGRITSLCGDIREIALPENVLFDVIVSNPPYITLEEMEELEPELSAEPRAALTDEGDGLSLLTTIITRYKHHLKPGGVLLLEHGATQSDAVCAIGEREGFTGRVLYDYGGHARGVLFSRPKDITIPIEEGTAAAQPV